MLFRALHVEIMIFFGTIMLILKERDYSREGGRTGNGVGCAKHLYV